MLRPDGHGASCVDSRRGRLWEPSLVGRWPSHQRLLLVSTGQNDGLSVGHHPFGGHSDHRPARGALRPSASEGPVLDRDAEGDPVEVAGRRRARASNMSGAAEVGHRRTQRPGLPRARNPLGRPSGRPDLTVHRQVGRAGPQGSYPTRSSRVCEGLSSSSHPGGRSIPRTPGHRGVGRPRPGSSASGWLMSSGSAEPWSSPAARLASRAG